jgi:hypothetical protein
MELSEYFNDSANLVTRERIYFHKIAFDLELAAARRGYHLQLFEPEVDRDGFDIVLNDHIWERHVQVKLVTVFAGTSNWDIRKRLLRPSEIVTNTLGYESMKSGLNGGFLSVLLGKDGIWDQVEYRYADCYTLFAIKQGLRRGDVKAADEAIRELFEDRGKEVSIKERLLLRVKGPDELLGILGLLNTAEVELSPWQFIQCLQPEKSDQALTPTPEVWMSKITEILESLVAR